MEKIANYMAREALVANRSLEAALSKILIFP